MGGLPPTRPSSQPKMPLDKAKKKSREEKGKKEKCKKYLDEEKEQCKKTCDQCDALPPSAPPPAPPEDECAGLEDHKKCKIKNCEDSKKKLKTCKKKCKKKKLKKKCKKMQEDLLRLILRSPSILCVTETESMATVCPSPHSPLLVRGGHLQRV